MGPRALRYCMCGGREGVAWGGRRCLGPRALRRGGREGVAWVLEP